MSGRHEARSAGGGVSAPPAGASTGRRLLGTALGLGLLPGAPGTWGSLGVVVVAGGLLGVDGWSGGLVPVRGGESPWLLRGAVVAGLALAFVVGVLVGRHAVADYGRDDPGAFVWDEVVGQGLALVPLLPGPLPPLGLATAFAAFRVFDIVKPPPARRLEGLHGGLGIMADDVAAGLYAMVIVAWVSTV